MAFNVRSILGRNKGPQLTGAEMQTARDNGINSVRNMRKNADAIRLVHQEKSKQWTGIYGDELRHDYDPFSPFNQRTPETDAAGKQLNAVREKEQFGVKAKVKKGIADLKPTSMPSAKGMFGIYD